MRALFGLLALSACSGVIVDEAQVSPDSLTRGKDHRGDDHCSDDDDRSDDDRSDDDDSSSDDDRSDDDSSSDGHGRRGSHHGHRDRGGDFTICHTSRGKSRTVAVDGKGLRKHLRHGDYLVGEEVCDGIDNDCDGVVDNAFGPVDLGSELVLNGSATYVVGSASFLHLTDWSAGTAGAAWLDHPVPTDALAVSFTFSMDNGRRGGGDGMTLTFLDADDLGALGDYGGWLGIAHSGYDGLSVELDTYRNAGFGDPNNNHIALVEAADLTPIATNASIPALQRSGEHVVDVELVGGAIDVWLDGVLVLSDVVTLPPEVQLGLTAGTASATNDHDVQALELSCP